ncbi:PAS domain-containing protein [Leptolyngbya sp. FACHB-671]|uniref:PAS domain-containing protein n=1 Tax=Leptolyngbya sp. FACHB-671 TaxID=2692812 RepID=UPI0018EFFAC1|nr:PAS domain-containing protein [Leptolyngbya sp. FACHB-671]
MGHYKLPVDVLVRQLEAAYERIFALYDDVNSTLVPSASILPSALKELGIASEELQVAAEELNQQSEELVATRAIVEAERQRYQNLFEFAPDGYFVTDLQGMIHQANQAAAQLLNLSQQFLTGRPIAGFVLETERQAFRSKLSQLHQSKRVQKIETVVQPRLEEPLNVALTVATIQNSTGEPVSLCWLMRRLAKRSSSPAQEKGYDPSQDYPIHSYAKGETVPLKPQEICLVNQGLVKLSTFSGNGKEVLMGLAGASMVFGSTLTSLSIYQAIAMSDVQLVYIPQEQINTSPRLANLLMPKIAQRLKQTEKLLLIAGQPRVKDRLWELLLLLKQEVGEPVEDGVRLNVRLTHEDLASACCTTRVTVTRLITHLLQTGQVSLNKHYIVLHD